MNTSKLSKAFETIQYEWHLEMPEYLNKICDYVVNKRLNPKTVRNILSSFKIEPEKSKSELLILILKYIHTALEDNILTHEELAYIRFLKMCFKIEEGDFIKYWKYPVENIIKYQLHRIYEDNKITDDEAVFKTELQEIFGMGYDEMNQYVKNEVIKSLRHGAKLEELDCAFSNREYNSFLV